jgi:hypothetical protein
MPVMAEKPSLINTTARIDGPSPGPTSCLITGSMFSPGVRADVVPATNWSCAVLKVQ